MDGTNARPFSDSGLGKINLLSVLVHYGDNVVIRNSDATSTEGTTPLNSFVTIRVEKQVASTRASLRLFDNDSARLTYDDITTPFASTRVIEKSENPQWNELLLCLLSNDYRAETAQESIDLIVDLVHRDNNQVNLLVASASIPLMQVPTHEHPTSFVLEFGPNKQHLPPIRIFITVSDTSYPTPQSKISEYLVHSFKPATDPSITKLDTLMVKVHTNANTHSLEGFSARTKWCHHFNVITDGLDIAKNVPSNDQGTLITPSARVRDGHIEWQYPFVIYHEINQGTMERSFAIEIYLHNAEQDAIGLGRLTIPNGANDGIPQSIAVDIYGCESNGKIGGILLGQVYLVIRQWDSCNWESFQRSSSSRRIVSANRSHQGRKKLQRLEWAGAICRGLNRYPISAFYDVGGLSSVMAFILKESVDENGNPGVAMSIDEGNTTCGNYLTDVSQIAVGTTSTSGTHLSNEHIRLLQQEIALKQRAIDKLQTELDGRVEALRTCGAELIATRKQLRQRDASFTQLQIQLDTIKQRDAFMTQELIRPDVSGLRLDSQASQRFNLLALKYKELEKEHLVTKSMLLDATRSNKVFIEQEDRYKELEHAHLVQAGLVQRLQTENAQITDLKRIVRLQEKVIRKFESMVKLSGPLNTTTKQFAPLSTTSELQIECLHEEPHQIVDNSDSQAAMLNVKVQILEERLRNNAKSAATEISRLKMRIMELEMQKVKGCKS